MDAGVLAEASAADIDAGQLAEESGLEAVAGSLADCMRRRGQAAADVMAMCRPVVAKVAATAASRGRWSKVEEHRSRATGSVPSPPDGFYPGAGALPRGGSVPWLGSPRASLRRLSTLAKASHWRRGRARLPASRRASRSRGWARMLGVLPRRPVMTWLLANLPRLRIMTRILGR